MSSFRTMPCISNTSKVAILSCLTRSQLPIHSSVWSSGLGTLSTLCGRNPTIRIASQIGRIPAQSVRWRACSGEAFKGSSSNSNKKNSSSSSEWGAEFHPRDWGLSKVRTFASSPQGSGNSQTEEQADVAKTVKKGLLVDAAEAWEEKLNKPEICTADELHYVAVPGTKWRLALWRYRPPPDVPQRNHPVLLLSGIGTNAIGFDLDPSVSLARTVAGAGFDTWILEVRGSGLSKSEEELAEEGKDAKASSGASVENKMTPDIVVDIQNKVSGKSTSERTGVNVLDPASKESSEPVSREGTVANVDPPEQNSTETRGEETSLAMSDMQNKKSGEHENGTLIGADPQDSTEIQKSDGGGASWQTWKTATELTNLIIDLSNKFSQLLTQGHSKILSARFIDSVASIIEESTLAKRIAELRDRLASLVETQQNSSSSVVQEITDLRKKLTQLLEDGQGVVRPRVTNLQERLNNTVDDFQKIVDLIAKYDWDFDDYLDEDVPTAMEYVRNQSKPADGKLLSVGHSMGGIVLYAMLSKRGNDCGLAGAVALASALDYQCSDTSLKLLLPLMDPALILNVPLVPLGALMTAVQPLISKPPYALGRLGYQVSAQNMMKTELFDKLILNNFGTVPVRLLQHLATVFQPGGLSNRDGTFKYKQNIGKVTVPVLAIAGDRDLICPPVAVLDTVNLFPKSTVTYKCVGGESRGHYGHYDIVCSPAATEEVFPVVLDFLLQNDTVKMQENEKIEVGI